MISLTSSRPISCQSKASIKSSNQKINSPNQKSATPTITRMSSQRTGEGLASPIQNFQLRPFSADTINIDNLQGICDEVIMTLPNNYKDNSSRQSFNVLQQMKCVLKPKKAQSAKASQKGKKSPLLLYKDNLNLIDDQLKSPEMKQDFSKQYSLISLKKQSTQNEKHKETCQFGAFSAFRKEDLFNFKRSNSFDSLQTTMGQSKFFSKPISVRTPTIFYHKSNSIDFNQQTLASTTETNRVSSANKQSTVIFYSF